MTYLKIVAQGRLRLALILGLLTNNLFAQEIENTAPARPKQVRLLTIGNSFSRNATHYLKDLVLAGGHRLTHHSIVVGGASLEIHATKAIAHERDPQNPAGLYADGQSLQQLLQADDWDYITIQQASLKSHDINTYQPFANTLQDVIRRHAPQAELLLHQTWAYRVDDPRFKTASKSGTEPATQTEMAQQVAAAYHVIAEELGIRCIPVGDAFTLAETDPHYGYRPDSDFHFATAQAPHVPRQTHSLHVGWRWKKSTQEAASVALSLDGHHANLAGEYLGACVWYEVLFEESSVGNAFVPQGLDPEYANFLQQSAHRAVTVAFQQRPTPARGRVAADPQPQPYKLQARASELDKRTKEYPEIDFVFGTKEKPQDLQHAAVDTRVAPQGKLVIWLMGNNDALSERLNSYGLHTIQVSYANKWFGKLCRPQPKDAQARGNVRLEAATGEDFSDELNLARPDGMSERAFQFVKWLAKENPQGNWQQFLSSDGKGLRWDKVIVSGSSHGSTTAARFAIHQRVDRVVMLCGPRDQEQDWQANPSATSSERYFGFSHVLDGGWSGDHYCRSWELLGMHKHGPIVTVDDESTPYQNSRRLISAAHVGGDANRAHSSVTPGRASPKGKNDEFLFEPVWKYLYTHPVNITGTLTAEDPECRRVHAVYEKK